MGTTGLESSFAVLYTELVLPGVLALGVLLERLTAGRLVAVSKLHRDLHRFGFDSLSALAAEGAKHVTAGAEIIRKYSEVANA